MADLAQALAGGVPLKWHIARVAALTGDTITITHSGGAVENVGVLDQYVPVVGDVVHILSSDLNGMLAIGSNNQAATGIPPGADPPVVPAPATTTGTFQQSTGTWLPGVLLESPVLTGCWFYTAASLAAGGSRPVTELTIRITALDATPLEFVLHHMVEVLGLLELQPGASYRVAAPPVLVPTDVRLPLEWASLLASGAAKGVGIGGGDYTGTFTGSSGLLSFTPLLPNLSS